MICTPCMEGNHFGCTSGDCACPQRIEDEQIERCLRAVHNGDEKLAETVYNSLLHSGSSVTRMLVDGAGRDSVVLFVQQVLRVNRAINC
jgi:hypothetical protein